MGKGLSANFKALEPKYEKASSSKTKKTFELHISAPIMYNQVEELLRDNRHLQEGIEFFLHSTRPIIEFQEMCRIMQKDFNFAIPIDLQEKLILQYQNNAAVEALKNLSVTNGYVQIKGDFKISDLDDKICLLTLIHPLNDFLEVKKPPVSILLHCHASWLKSPGRTAFEKGETVRITCVGKIVRWREETRSLVICPLSIF